MRGDFSLPDDDSPRRSRCLVRDPAPVTIVAADPTPAAPPAMEAPAPFAWLAALKAARRWDR